jgi:Ca-activated chloride channel family protein
MAPYPFMTERGVVIQQVPVEIDEDMLKQISDMTDGKYFRAIDNTKLLEIYSEINQMEKAKITVDSLTTYKEEFMPFALAALAALLLELLLRLLVLRRLP